MRFEEFVDSLAMEKPPSVGSMLEALWYDGKGDWDQSHNIVQSSSEAMAYRIHGYLHWKEGDLGNAGYWYSRAGVSRPDHDLQAEWESLVRELL